MTQVTSNQAEQLKNHVQKELYFNSFQWFHSYFEITYLFPEFPIELDFPQWTHLANIIKTDKGYFVVVAILNDYFQRDYDYILKYPVISVYNEVSESTKFNILRKLK